MVDRDSQNAAYGYWALAISKDPVYILSYYLVMSAFMNIVKEMHYCACVTLKKHRACVVAAGWIFGAEVCPYCVYALPRHLINSPAPVHISSVASIRVTRR